MCQAGEGEGEMWRIGFGILFSSSNGGVQQAAAGGGVGGGGAITAYYINLFILYSEAIQLSCGKETWTYIVITHYSDSLPPNLCFHPLTTSHFPTIVMTSSGHLRRASQMQFLHSPIV